LVLLLALALAASAAAAFLPTLAARGLVPRHLEWDLAWIVILARALWLTLALEVPVVAVAGKGTPRALAAGVLVNTLTFPLFAVLMTLAMPLLFLFFDLYADLLSPIPALVWPALALAVAEVGIVVVEGVALQRALGWPTRRAMTTSLLANGLSVAVSLLLVRLAA